VQAHTGSVALPRSDRSRSRASPPLVRIGRGDLQVTGSSPTRRRPGSGRAPIGSKPGSSRRTYPYPREARCTFHHRPDARTRMIMRPGSAEPWRKAQPASGTAVPASKVGSRSRMPPSRPRSSRPIPGRGVRPGHVPSRSPNRDPASVGLVAAVRSSSRADLTGRNSARFLILRGRDRTARCRSIGSGRAGSDHGFSHERSRRSHPRMVSLEVRTPVESWSCRRCSRSRTGTSSRRSPAEPV